MYENVVYSFSSRWVKTGRGKGYILNNMQLDPDEIQNLVTLAFALEPLAEKPGCTSRLVDLPGKPLSDFIITGINVGKFFRLHAQDTLANAEACIFTYFLAALKSANRYKSPKTLNFGLLEIMFPVVSARLHVASVDEVVDCTIQLMQRVSSADVRALIDARKEAWKSSQQEGKRAFDGKVFAHAVSPFAFYELLYAAYPKDSSNNQWAMQYMEGLPVLRQFLDGLLNTTDALASIARTYIHVVNDMPELKKGIIADMAAAALFIHYSFLNVP